MIHIAGGGLTGLVALRQLLNRGFDITLIEARAEIGLPTRSPGWLRDSDLLHELPQDLLESSEGVSFGDGFGFRRGWFDRRLAQHLGDGGVRISTRTEVVIRDGLIHLLGAGPADDGPIAGPRVLDALGSVPSLPGFDWDSEVLRGRDDVIGLEGGSDPMGGRCVHRAGCRRGTIHLDTAPRRHGGALVASGTGGGTKHPKRLHRAHHRLASTGGESDLGR